MGFSGRDGKVRSIVINGMRIILIVALAIGFFRQRDLILVVSLVGLVVTFIPTIMHKMFKIEVPAAFEIISLLFVYGLLYLGEVRGIYEQFWIVGVMLKLLASVIFGFIGLATLYSLYKQEKVQSHPMVIAFFAFCFAVSVAALWEVFEFSLDSTLGLNLQKSGFDTMKDIISSMIGALFVSGAGYYYLKKGKIILISALVEKAVAANAKKMGIRQNPDRNKEHVMNLVKNGENSGVEFKSTLRTNLHTGAIDKNVEHAALKTMAGYMNADGGTLLVGVDDTRNIIGLEKDNFPSHDKLGLHLTNLIKQHIGAEYLPVINFEVVEMDNKHVLKIECRKSNREVFVRDGKDEHFYVRNGPSTAMLTGSSLVEYITNRFR